VSSKQTIFCFGSNRNKLKLDLFRFCTGLFLETKYVFRFVSEPFRNEPKQKWAVGNKPNLKINTLLCNGHGRRLGHGNGHAGDFLFRFKPKQTETRYFSVFFAKITYFFRFVCIGTFSKRTETKNRRFETNRNRD
jgi:hypothetical protein